MANSGFRSSYIAKRNKRFGQLSFDDDLFNLNQSTSWVKIPLNVEEKLDKGFRFKDNGLEAQFADWVDVDAMVYMESSNPRPNVEIVVAVNNIQRAKIGSSAYIRNSNGHNHSSAHITDGFNVNVGDVITLWCRRDANAGTVISPQNSICFKAVSSPVDIVRGPAGTYTEGFELGFGQWSQVGSDNWTRFTGPTPSGGTGTAGAKSGAFYVYTEVSNGANTETFGLSTSYFNKIRQVDFSFQLEGDDCGTLLLQYKNKFGVWVTKWSVTGSQGSSYIDVSEDFSAIPDVDDILEIRFFYSGATDFEGDCCLDEISVISV
ncbi:MAG: hypothetical protein HRU18_01680 [Pseudoalteromonas sp.]|uniref:hypothetical protein n=1 Tax=Pseudoalteromonas sp. TaxID=53249 RepID=UPI001D4B8C32|nr:hypothetical protein [Pseudoalteromonas sp.]NRA76892.1 hypothetical protein [Pseudoalteromonas sp.]